MRLGIDVGGTNTDAVVLDGRRIVAMGKVPTTEDVTSGIVAATSAALSRLDSQVPRFDSQAPRFDAVVVGTTHFINALAEARRLAPVTVIRLATPPQTLRPLVDWPSLQRTAIGEHVYVCSGGAQYDGRRLGDLDVPRLREIGKASRDAGVVQVAITGTFAPVNAEDELHAAEVISGVFPGAQLTLSHEIGRVGILERENATVVNAALRPLAETVIASLANVLRELRIDAPIFLSQNDGTLMNVETARSYPVFTIASGPTNSMRGAAFLSVVDDCVVVDVGGTTTDVGLLRNGFPRESPVAASLAGIRSNFRMPDVQSLAIGGGSIVDADGSVGPLSVGYRLTSAALVFGGDTVTLTDVAVAAGMVSIGDAERVRALPTALVERALDSIRVRIGAAVDQAKLVAGDLPVVVVGGGAVLVDRLPGVSRLVRPDNGHVANAVGAAFAQAGGELDRVYSLTGRSRQEVLSEARAEAVRRAVESGAVASTVAIVDEEDVPLSHLPDGTALRVRVKAIGDVAIGVPA